MTSSLVGSEMCIRDRPFLALAKTLAGEGRRSQRSTAILDRQLGLQGFVSVSYTHLTLPTICSV
eukprot:9342922-Prorocentrum_lima.AAC.1